MSDFSRRLVPRIGEPSNISWLSRAFSSSVAGIEMFFSWPYSSVNCRRTNFTSCSRQRSISSRLSTSVSSFAAWEQNGRVFPAPPPACTSPHRDPAHADIAARLHASLLHLFGCWQWLRDRHHPLD